MAVGWEVAQVEIRISSGENNVYLYTYQEPHNAVDTVGKGFATRVPTVFRGFGIRMLAYRMGGRGFCFGAATERMRN